MNVFQIRTLNVTYNFKFWFFENVFNIHIKNSFKPEDWDDNAPRMIDDPDRLEPPADWLLDEEYRIPDPDASEPEHWDEEEDGDDEGKIGRKEEKEEKRGEGLQAKALDLLSRPDSGDGDEEEAKQAEGKVEDEYKQDEHK